MSLTHHSLNTHVFSLYDKIIIFRKFNNLQQHFFDWSFIR